MTNIIDITEFLTALPHTRHEVILDFEKTRPQFVEIRDVMLETYYGKGNKDQNAVSFGESVIKDLKSCGTFYNCPPHQFYSFANTVMVDLDDKSPLLKILLSNYKAAKGHRAIPTIRCMLQTHCSMHGTGGEIRHFAYYDKDAGALYRSNFSNHMWRIDSNGVNIVLNGKEAVMFRGNPAIEALDHHAKPGEGLFDEIVLAPLVAQLDPDNDYGISVDDQVKIFEYWFYSLFFESTHPTKPIMCALGPAGSGKTSVLRRVGQILFGNSFDVSSMPESRKDFDASVLGSSYVVFDNVDGFRPWMCDGLSQVSTGTIFEYRKLYTNYETTIATPRCFLGITARTPKFARDDVSSRCLFLHTQKIEKTVPERDMIAQIANNRDALNAEINLRLQRIVSFLVQGSTPNIGSFRMADFANFCLQASLAFDEQDTMRGIFERITGSQATFTLENSSFADVFRLWVNDCLLEARSMTLENVRGEMTKVADEHKIELFGLNKPHSFRSQFMTNLDSLRNIGFSIKPTASKDKRRHKVWKFGPGTVQCS